MYLIRDGKIEFKGNKKQLIEYVCETYQDDIFINTYQNCFLKDFEQFKFCCENLGLVVISRKYKNGH